MKNPLYIGFGVGLVAIAIAVGAVFYMQRGAHIQVTGKILKVRTAPIDERSAVAVLDFRLTNPADYTFMVRDVTIVLEDAAGGQREGNTVAGTDTERLFAGLPLLGPKYNATLIARSKIAPHETGDYMAAARFEVPDTELEKRKRFVLQISEVDGAVSEIREK